MNKKKELKKGIIIKDDLTKREREIQQKLREKAREEREKEDSKAKIGYKKIYLNGKWYRWNEKEEKLKEEKRIEEDKWKKISKKVSNRYEWNGIPAIKENIKRRAKGGIITAIKKDLEGIKVKEINKGVIEINFIYNKNRRRIVTLYSQNNEETLDNIRKEIEKEKKGYLMLGGYFNARTGAEGGPIGIKKGRREKKIKRQMIDYVVSNEKAIEEVKKVEKGNRTESDHVPVEVELEGREKRKMRKSNMVKIERSIWSEEGVEYYHGKCKG
ncbi:sperm-associated antigen 17-like [Linepithema humile]|uniref:sperm-associated antigen 17-like n=1 Tax=Linepithema humile TaxID=83485 RepID=UPI00351F4799